MKTITKTFYVSDEYIKHLKKEKNEISDPVSFWGHDFKVCYSPQEKNFSREIQISWQEPERKIEITESEFDEICRNYKLNGEDCEKHSLIIAIKNDIFGAEK